jgi:hypothetical protein
LGKTLHSFEGIKQALESSRLERVLEGALAGDASAVIEILKIPPSSIPATKKKQIAARLYTTAKDCLARQELSSAGDLFLYSARLAPDNRLYSERASLLRRRQNQPGLERLMGLQEFQRQLHCICTKSPCTCLSYFQIAQCRNLVDPDFPCEYNVGGIRTLTLGAYHAWRKSGQWTRRMKAAKQGGGEDDRPIEILNSMADALADYLLEATDVLGIVDVIVPIPPSAEKKFNRGGLAPNEVVSERLSQHLALPVRSILVRLPGEQTHRASESELSRQYGVSSGPVDIANLGILLVDDVWTHGRTIPICADKLSALRPREVIAATLSHGTF